MTGPERDAQLPRDDSPVTATQTNTPSDGAESVETPDKAADGHTGPQPRWAQTVASHGTGDTRTIDIDIDGLADGWVPMELPIDEARTLHAMLGDAINDTECSGDCGAMRCTHGCVEAADALVRERVEDERRQAACLRPGTCSPGDPCSPCLAAAGRRTAGGATPGAARNAEAWAKLTAEEADAIRNEVRRELYRQAIKYLHRNGPHATLTVTVADGVDTVDCYTTDSVKADLRMLAFGPKHPEMIAFRAADDGSWP